MFGRKPKDYEQSENLELTEEMLSPETTLDLEPPKTENYPVPFPETAVPQPEEPVPEVVKVVDKISSILSPYFIVIVGLYLYKTNFLIGFILITIGVFSLLKLSPKKVGQWIEEFLNFIGFKE
ncbi:conserved hypothetical protein [Gloeothece citriformis PCC 7424]|uniref:Uncharacterized protein n=1 Tax=Gloeothece citriformis (strain PCC 7424) TaxID=65393 RepID=B7K6Z7_GLOC7|nr:hypothetical protein [Gloeothece citriformis]ACK72696.1 conserved hypothetical protein [Gloeothece citriformis PCC 7424]